MIVNAGPDLFSILIGGGTYHFTPDSNVMLVTDDFTGLDKFTEPLVRVAMKTRCTFIGLPSINKGNYEKSALKPVIDWFLKNNFNPSFLFCIRVYPSLVMESGVSIIKRAAIDHGKLVKKISGIGFEWLDVKEEEEIDFIAFINAKIQREWELLSSMLVVSENSMDQLSTLVSYLRANRYERESGI